MRFFGHGFAVFGSPFIFPYYYYASPPYPYYSPYCDPYSPYYDPNYCYWLTGAY